MRLCRVGEVPQPRATICSTASPLWTASSAGGAGRRYPASTYSSVPATGSRRTRASHTAAEAGIRCRRVMTRPAPSVHNRWIVRRVCITPFAGTIRATEREKDLEIWNLLSIFV